MTGSFLEHGTYDNLESLTERDQVIFAHLSSPNRFENCYRYHQIQQRSLRRQSGYEVVTGGELTVNDAFGDGADNSKILRQE